MHIMHSKYHTSSLLGLKGKESGGHEIMPLQNTPLWHKHYLELEAMRAQQIQKDAFPKVPFSDEKKIPRNEDGRDSCLWQIVWPWGRWSVVTEMSLHTQILINNPHFLFVYIGYLFTTLLNAIHALESNHLFRVFSYFLQSYSYV